MTDNLAIRPGRGELGQLKLVVDAAREDVAECRQFDYTDRQRLVRAQRHLLSALEVYARALEAAGLEPHPQLRGEVDLLRAVTDASRQRSS